MNIKLVGSEAEIAACHAVMRELRPHLDPATFVHRVRSQQESGYRLAYLEDGGRPVAVAGFRLGECLAWGRFLYVDDLVTLSSERSRGHGAALLAWLAERAREARCDELHLDSGVQRKDAHRFYQREGMELTGFHFRTRLR
jgi:GNAT superfamily N-acetyltransferase